MTCSPRGVVKITGSLSIANFSFPISKERAPTNLQEYLVAGYKSKMVMWVPKIEGLYKVIGGDFMS